MKVILLKLEDLDNIVLKSSGQVLTLDSILRKLIKENPGIKKDTKTVSLTTMARILIARLKQVDQSYSENGYAKLYKIICRELDEFLENSLDKMTEYEILLARALETLTEKCQRIKDDCEKAQKTLRGFLTLSIIKKIKIPLCISSPSQKDHILSQKESKKKKKKKKGELTSTHITFTDPKECVHERITVILEIASGMIYLFCKTLF